MLAISRMNRSFCLYNITAVVLQPFTADYPDGIGRAAGVLMAQDWLLHGNGTYAPSFADQKLQELCINLVFMNDNFNPSEAARQAQLAAEDAVNKHAKKTTMRQEHPDMVAYIGPSGSSQCAIVSQLAAQMTPARPVIGISCTATSLSDKVTYPYFYRMALPDDVVSQAILAFAKYLNADSVGCIIADAAYPRSIADAINQLASEAGVATFKYVYADGSANFDGVVDIAKREAPRYLAIVGSNALDTFFLLKRLYEENFHATRVLVSADILASGQPAKIDIAQDSSPTGAVIFEELRVVAFKAEGAHERFDAFKRDWPNLVRGIDLSQLETVSGFSMSVDAMDTLPSYVVESVHAVLYLAHAAHYWLSKGDAQNLQSALKLLTGVKLDSIGTLELNQNHDPILHNYDVNMSRFQGALDPSSFGSYDLDSQEFNLSYSAIEDLPFLIDDLPSSTDAIRSLVEEIYNTRAIPIGGQNVADGCVVAVLLCLYCVGFVVHMYKRHFRKALALTDERIKELKAADELPMAPAVSKVDKEYPDCTNSCADVLMAGVCLWQTKTASCGARMLIPFATSVQVKAMGLDVCFSISSLPSEEDETGMVVACVVHCLPEGLLGIEFEDPVWIQLPLPHRIMSRGFQIVTREHGSNGWHLYLEEARVHIHDGRACFSARHFCDFGIRAETLIENEDNCFSVIPYIRYRTVGYCDMKCLTFSSDCARCQNTAKQLQGRCLGDWQQVGDGTILFITDQSKLKVSCVVHRPEGDDIEEADMVLDVRIGPKLMTLHQLPLGSKVKLQVFSSSNKPVQSEDFLRIPAGPAPDLYNGVVACGTGATLLNTSQDIESWRRDQNTDEVDTSCVSRLQEASKVERVDLFCDGAQDCLETLSRKLQDTRPVFFVIHGHGHSESDVPIGISAHNHQRVSGCEDLQLYVTFKRLAEVIRKHVQFEEQSGLARLKLVIVRSCFGYPLAKMVSEIGLDAVSWIQSPQVDHANEFTINMVKTFLQQGAQDTRKAFEETRKKLMWSITGTLKELEAAKSVEFFAPYPEVVVWELCPEGTDSAGFQTWPTWAQDKGHVMVFKGPMTHVLESSRLTRTCCMLFTGAGRMEELHEAPRLAEVLPEVRLLIFAGNCSSLADHAHENIKQNGKVLVLPFLEDLEFMNSIDEPVDGSRLDKLWTVMFGPGSVKVLMDRLVRDGLGGTEDLYQLNRPKVRDYVLQCIYERNAEEMDELDA